MEVRKVFICEDHTIVLDGLKLVLEQFPEFKIIGNAGQGKGLLTTLESQRPDILILDLNLPDTDGFTLLEEIRSVNKTILIIILTMYNDESLVDRAKRAGANAFLLKNVDNQELIHVLRNAKQDTFYLSQSLKNESEKKKMFQDRFTNRMKLTDREIEIIRLLAQGHSSAYIAKTLFLSTHTVNTHRKNILRKLEVSSTVELVNFAHANNLL
ncbi:MAG TPA: response regulator transcription factor [Cyclobacteriaceae bacterium]